jgi:hypothetical protein
VQCMYSRGHKVPLIGGYPLQNSYAGRPSSTSALPPPPPPPSGSPPPPPPPRGAPPPPPLR